jgi:hypothetical protein
VRGLRGGAMESPHLEVGAVVAKRDCPCEVGGFFGVDVGEDAREPARLAHYGRGLDRGQVVVHGHTHRRQFVARQKKRPSLGHRRTARGVQRGRRRPQAFSRVARLQGIERLGIAGPGVTLGSPWPPLAIRPCKRPSLGTGPDLEPKV